MNGFRPGRRARLPHLVAASVLVNLFTLFAFMAKPANAAETFRVVAFGDSLTAGYMLPEAAAFPARLQKALAERGHDVKITNAGVSGDTTAAALQRLDWSIPDDTNAVIVQLGGNDALRGLSPDETRKNLDAILSKLKARGIDVLLAGMAAPRGLGKEYVAAFDPIYPELAAKHGVLLYPFFLDGIVEKAEYNLDDGMHPNAAGVGVIVDRILPTAEELLKRVQARHANGQTNSKS